jgi:hypothetical protein
MKNESKSAARIGPDPRSGSGAIEDTGCPAFAGLLLASLYRLAPG